MNSKYIYIYIYIRINNNNNNNNNNNILIKYINKKIIYMNDINIIIIFLPVEKINTVVKLLLNEEKLTFSFK